jgi:hypothetical protein
MRGETWCNVMDFGGHGLAALSGVLSGNFHRYFVETWYILSGLLCVKHAIYHSYSAPWRTLLYCEAIRMM